MIYDEINQPWIIVSRPFAIVERARRVLELDYQVAFVAGNVIHFYADRATLDSDLERPGGANYENAAVVVSCDPDLNFEIVE